MSEASEPAAEPAAEPAEEQKPTETVEFWKQQARENEKRAKANATAATELEAIRESQKSETQKAADRLAEAERTAATAQTDAIRYRVAATKGVPAELIDRLRGDTEDEMTADADSLLALLAKQGAPGTPIPDPSQGARGSASGSGDPAGDFERFMSGKLSG